MIQDILPKVLHNEFEVTTATSEDVIVVFREREVLISRDEDDSLRLPFYKEIKGNVSDESSLKEGLQFVFRIDDKAVFLYKSWNAQENSITVPEGFGYEPVRDIRQMISKDVCFAVMTAWHLAVWYRDNQYCGRCGHKTVHDDNERMVKCPSCGNMIFPKIAPAVIVALTSGDKIMMTKYAPTREYQRYALIAGFTEIGETAEETVVREVAEEVGLHVKNIRYYKSQPWGVDSNLLMGYFAELEGSSDVSMDQEELSKAEWFKRDDMPAHDDGISLTREMMSVFENETAYNEFVAHSRISRE